MSEIFCCPMHGEALRSEAPNEIVGVDHGERYPVVDGIPVLLPDVSERQRVASIDAISVPAVSSALDFYNRTGGGESYYPNQVQRLREELSTILSRAAGTGLIVEIGSGSGGLQGLGGDDYVAIDYSLTALRRFINPLHKRACATAERLPLRDSCVRFLFSIDVFEHVPNPNLALAEVDRVLKPGAIAYLLPAWHCVQYNCQGIATRPYADLTLRQKLVKFSLPIRTTSIMKAISTLPARVARRAAWATTGRKATEFHFTRLRPDYENFWQADCDACSRLDAHEAVLFFRSRNYEILNPAGGALSELLMRHVPLVVRKRPA